MLLKLSQKFGFRSAKCAPVNWTGFDINCHLSLPPCELVQLSNSSQFVGTFSFHVGVYGIGYQARNSLHTATLHPNKFCHL